MYKRREWVHEYAHKYKERTRVVLLATSNVNAKIFVARFLPAGRARLFLRAESRNFVRGQGHTADPAGGIRPAQVGTCRTRADNNANDSGDAR